MSSFCLYHVKREINKSLRSRLGVAFGNMINKEPVCGARHNTAPSLHRPQDALARSAGINKIFGFLLIRYPFAVPSYPR